MIAGTITRHGQWHSHIHRCLICGGIFHSKRSDALYCGSKCRQKAYRKRKRYERQQHRMKCVQLGLPIPDGPWDYAKRTYNL